MILAYLAGIGDKCSVDYESNAINVLEKLKEKTNRSLNFIQFHVHTEETVKICGQKAANDFSINDKLHIDLTRKCYPHSISLLVTPIKYLFNGLYDITYEVNDWLSDDGYSCTKLRGSLDDYIQKIEKSKKVHREMRHIQSFLN